MQINVLEYLEKTVEKSPKKIAVIEGEKNINFQDLVDKSKKIANFIIAKNFISLPIAVYLPKTVDSVVTDIAITYSGNAYMNLDVKTPLERIKNIVELISPKIIITNSKLKSKVEDFGVEILDIDEFDFSAVVDQKAIDERLSNIIDADPYCIINTSGSTGTPKGVVLNHKSFVDFIERSIEIFKFSDHEIMGSLSPLVFDIYSFELCMLMAKSSTIVLIPDTLSAFPIEILKILEAQKVSFLFWVPTIMVNIANMDLLTKISLPHLKLVWFAGEVFPTKQFNYWYKNLPQTRFANLYGPIEITLDCTYYIVDKQLRDEEPIPIGKAYKNTDILILNDKDELAVGEEGELCVRGTSLAMGYYNNPEKTKLAFVQNPLNHSYPEVIYRTGDIVYANEDGNIVFKGRKDSLVKHQGYRIELGEIEHVVVNTLKIVKNGCVVYNFSKKEITLFYETDNEISGADFRHRIGQMLPKYMVPTVYHQMELLPRNTNGKIDRLALKVMVENNA